MKRWIQYIHIANNCMRKNYQTADKNAYLGIQREIIEYHGTYKCNLGCLRIHYFVPSIYPQSSQLGQDIYYLKKQKMQFVMLVCIDEIWLKKNRDIEAENYNTQGFQSYSYVHVKINRLRVWIRRNTTLQYECF